MRDRREGWAWTALMAGAVMLAAMGGSLAQNPPAPKAKVVPKHKGHDAAPTPLKKAMPNAADPLADPAVNPFEMDTLSSDYHFKFKLHSFDDTTLAATYYPSRLKTRAPVLLLVHEKGRSSKDFEDPILDLKNQGLAEHAQARGYAVLTFDLRGQGLNRGLEHRAVLPQDWRMMINDLQAAYTFLLDRNNRGQLNLGKLGVLGVGEGANLAAAWAAAPGGAVSTEGRTSDLGALVLVSPLADGAGLALAPLMNQLALRFPLLLMAGGGDPSSGDPVRASRPYVERPQLRGNLVKLYDSKLHGWKLLRYEPRAATEILSFFERSIKFKVFEWEPRYNLNPVAVTDITTVRNAKVPAAAAAKEKEAVPAKEKEAPEAK